MERIDVAIQAAKKGGAIALRYFETDIDREVKEDKSFVTQADKESEEAIISEIKRYFPDHNFLGEESGITHTGSEYEWIIDPIDGTGNYVNGIPLFSVSIALLMKGELVAGVIYNPVGDSLYTAEKGKGTFWNKKRVHVSNGDTEHAMISFCPGRKEKEKLNTLFPRAEQFVKSKRYLGSAALELAYVARGGTEGVLFAGLNKWDYAAGVLLVQEAGGTITDFEGRSWTFGSSDFFIASNGIVHSSLLKLVAVAS